MICATAQAQFNRTGSDLNGSSDDGLTALKNLGLIAAWDARYGLSFSSTTNISQWNDLTGNFVLRQPVVANQPVFHPAFPSFSNPIPTVYFNGTPKVMVENRIASELNQTNFTLILLTCPRQQAANVGIAMGSTSSTSATFSVVGAFGLNSATGNQQFRYSPDSGGGTLVAAQTPNISTNFFKYFGTTFSNNFARVYANNTNISVLTAVSLTSNLNTFAVGSLVGSNSFASLHWQGGMSGIYLFKGALSTNQYLDVETLLNTERPVH